MRHDYVPRMINLERSDYQIVRQIAEERGLGENGLHAGVRMIFQEWWEFQLLDLNRLTAEAQSRCGLPPIEPAPKDSKDRSQDHAHA